MATDAAAFIPFVAMALLLAGLMLGFAQEHRRHPDAAKAAVPTTPPHTRSASAPSPASAAAPRDLSPVVAVELEVGASRVLCHPDDAARLEPELLALLAEGPPDRCPGCGRQRILLLSWRVEDKRHHEFGVVRGCVWCDAGTDHRLAAVWDVDHWLLRWGYGWSTADDPVLRLVVRQHLEAIARERPQLPARRPDDVARLWAHVTADGSRTQRSTDDALALVRLLNPWLDLAAARRFLLHVAHGDPRVPAPRIVGELRDVSSAARTAEDEMALLRAEVAAVPKERPPIAVGAVWRTRWRHDNELQVHLEVAFHGPDGRGPFRWRVTLDDVVHDDPSTPPGVARLFRELVPEHGLASALRRDLAQAVLTDYDLACQAPYPWGFREPRELWSEHDWSGTLAQARRARLELAALSYPPQIRRALMEWLDLAPELSLEARSWPPSPEDPGDVDARTPEDVHRRATELLSDRA